MDNTHTSCWLGRLGAAAQVKPPRLAHGIHPADVRHAQPHLSHHRAVVCCYAAIGPAIPRGAKLAADRLLTVLSYNLLAPIYVRPIDERTGAVQQFAAFAWAAERRLRDFSAIANSPWAL